MTDGHHANTVIGHRFSEDERLEEVVELTGRPSIGRASLIPATLEPTSALGDLSHVEGDD